MITDKTKSLVCKGRKYLTKPQNKTRENEYKPFILQRNKCGKSAHQYSQLVSLRRIVTLQYAMMVIRNMAMAFVLRLWRQYVPLSIMQDSRIVSQMVGEHGYTATGMDEIC